MPTELQEAKQALQDLHSLFDDFKSVVEKEKEELKKLGSPTGEIQLKVAKMNDAIGELQTIVSRPGFGAKQEVDRKEEPEYKAFFHYTRKGDDNLSPEEQKTLATDDNANGGYRVPKTVANFILENVRDISPLRRLCSVQTIGGNIFEILQKKGTAAGGWTSERGARDKTGTPTFGKLEIPVSELYAYPEATQNMLDDADFDVEAWLAAEIAETFAELEGTAFLNGTGKGQPEGILVYDPAGTSDDIGTTNSGDANLVKPDSLIDISYALHEAYLAGATWLMRRATEGAIRKLKDGQNNYLWQPSFQVGVPASLLGFPIEYDANMPALAANAFPVLFGNFKKGYQIIDKATIGMLRDPYTNKPFVGFYTTKRVGGQVIKAEALKKYKIAV